MQLLFGRNSTIPFWQYDMTLPPWSLGYMVVILKV